MKVKELVKIGEKIMKMLHERGINMEYYQHLPMVEEFDIMKDMGHKTTYIIAHLSEKYGICERKVYKIIGKMKPVTIRPVDDVTEILKTNGVKIPDECVFDAWYLYMMSIADYPKTLTTDKLRASYVEETVCDPDGKTTNVLACFDAKMCNAGKPIHWEMFI